MGEPGDVRLNRTPAPVFAPDSGTGSRGPLLTIVVLVLVAAALVAGYLVWRGAPKRADTARPPQVPVKTEDIALPAEPGENIDLPPLDESDTIVRELVRKLSEHPRVTAWLATDNLLRNFTVVTVNIAGGQSPAKHLRGLGPQGPFLVRGVEGNLTVDPRSYARYDGYADAVAALDARGTARLFATLRPRIEDAARELGTGSEGFDPVLERAIVELLRTPVVTGEIRLQPSPVAYAYSDPRLESLSAAQKQFLRMGPRNVALIKSKLREIATALGIPDSRLPPAS